MTYIARVRRARCRCQHRMRKRRRRSRAKSTTDEIRYSRRVAAADPSPQPEFSAEYAPFYTAGNTGRSNRAFNCWIVNAEHRRDLFRRRDDLIAGIRSHRLAASAPDRRCGRVETRSRIGGKGTGDESIGGQRRVVEVPPHDAAPADPQLAGNAERHGPPSVVEDIETGIGDRPVRMCFASLMVAANMNCERLAPVSSAARSIKHPVLSACAQASLRTHRPEPRLGRTGKAGDPKRSVVAGVLRARAMERQAIDAVTDLGMRIGDADGGEAVADRFPRRAAVIGAQRARDARHGRTPADAPCRRAETAAVGATLSSTGPEERRYRCSRCRG
jgi:hypothetical protein